MHEEASSIAETFNTEWAKDHLGRHPFGPLLRQDASLPWVRFHALPGSKRYAENDNERQVILDRANALGEQVLGDATPCWFIATDFCEMRADWVLAGKYEDDVGGPDEFVVPFYVQAVEWRSGHFDAELTSIAEDDTRFLWMSRTSGAILAPYDGGFDIFSPDADEIASLKATFHQWLSTALSGL